MVAEAYGAFVLTFIGATSITVVSDPKLFAAGPSLGLGFIGLAHGIALLIGIATVAQISGAHFNPAVTIGMTAAGRFPKNRVLPYIGAQLVGAVLAALVQLGTVGMDAARISYLGSPLPNSSIPIYSALLAEIIGTMMLVMTVLGSTDRSSSLPWSSSAIGLTLAAVIWALGAVSGASLNPARSFGPAVVSLIFSTTPMAYYPFYVVGPAIGGLLAAALYRFMFGRNAVKSSSARSRVVERSDVVFERPGG
jgi:glycerol uptake facilitator protein